MRRCDERRFLRDAEARCNGRRQVVGRARDKVALTGAIVEPQSIVVRAPREMQHHVHHARVARRCSASSVGIGVSVGVSRSHDAQRDRALLVQNQKRDSVVLGHGLDRVLVGPDTPPGTDLSAALSNGAAESREAALLERHGELGGWRRLSRECRLDVAHKVVATYARQRQSRVDLDHVVRQTCGNEFAQRRHRQLAVALVVGRAQCRHDGVVEAVAIARHAGDTDRGATRRQAKEAPNTLAT